MEKLTAGKRIRALVTRPLPDANKTAEALKSRGFEVIIEPMLDIQPIIGAKPSLLAALTRLPQAVLITSANGIRMFAACTDERDIAIIAVGDSSAEEADELGFVNVNSAQGDVESLKAFVINHCDPQQGFLLHIAGSVTAGELQEDLEHEGFTFERIAIYNALAAKAFSPVVKSAIANTEIDIVIFYSKRTAAIFDDVMKKERLDYLAPTMQSFYLSNVSNTHLSWRSVHISPEPNEPALLTLIDKVTSSNINPHEG